MSWWNRATNVVRDADGYADIVRSAPVSSAPVESLTVPLWGDAQSVSPDSAMRVPSFNRATRLICGTVAQLPLVTWRGADMTPGNGLLRQPEADRPVSVTIYELVRDLCWYARGYWLVIDVDPNGFPTRIKPLPAPAVAPSLTRPATHVQHDGRDYRISHPAGPGTNVGDVIVFHGYGPGVLAAGSQTIALAIALDDAARRYADSPLPSVALKNDGADLPPDQVQALLAAWEEARATRTTAYLNSVMKAETFGFSPAELTLTDARNFAAIEIARLFNLDAFWIGANMPGASLSYSNRVDLRKDLIDLTLADFIVPIEQRLSMRDITPTFSTNLVRFNTTEFLRSNLAERTQIVATLLPLGVITEAQAQEFLSDNPTPGGGLT